MRARLLSNLLKRRVLAALVLVFAILGGSVVYAQAGRPTTTYRTSLVTYGTITQTIGMAGNLAPVTEADLNFASPGTVVLVEAEVGQTVIKGALLAALDPTVLAAQLSQAKANLSSAKAKLAQDQAGPTAQALASAKNPVSSAQVAVNNAKVSLADTKAINAQLVAAAQAVVDTSCPTGPTCALDQQALAMAQVKAQQSNNQAAAQLASAQQQLTAAKSSLAAFLAGSTSAQTIQIDAAQVQIEQVNVNTLQHQLDGARLVSPIAGVVAQVNIKEGQSVTAGGTSYAMVVYTPGSYEVTGTVSDSQVNLVALGQTVQVTPAGSTQAVLGKVSAIAPAATISSGVATFGVTAQLSDTSNSIKPGVSANASIVVNQVVHVLTVPTSAVHTTATGSTVQILVNGAPQSVPVEVGASDPTRTEILSGLQLNQVVVIAVVTSSVPNSGAGAVFGGGGGRGGGGAVRGGG